MTKDATDEEISVALRGSKTLVVNNQNCFDSTSVKAVFSERGACIHPKKHGDVVFQRYLLLYLLARSYNLFREEQVKRVAEAYDCNDIKRMNDCREKVLSFSLKSFYTNPVIFERHELRQAWLVLAKQFDLKQVHSEMTSQVQDLSELILTKQQSTRDARYKRLELMFWIFGFIVAVVTLADSETLRMLVHYVWSLLCTGQA